MTGVADRANPNARRRFLLSAAGLVAAPGLAFGASAPWRVVGMQEFPPYNYRRQGRFIGADVDILNAAARRMGITMQMIPLPWPRALLALDMAEADALFQLTATPKRIRDWHMIGPLRMTRLVFCVRGNSDIADVPNVDALRGRSVGVVRGFTYTRAFDSAAFVHHEGSFDDATSLRKLLLKRVDLVLGGEANLRWAIRQLGAEDKLRILPTALAVQPRFVGFSRDPESMRKAQLLQRTLTAMTNEGQISAILRQSLADLP